MKLNSLLNKNAKIFVICTGAGAGIQNELWKVPGCSSFFVGAEFTYAMHKTSKAIGYTPTKFVSEQVAIELAMSAYQEAYLSDTENPIGLGLTASAASTRIHRGDHKVIAATITKEGCRYSTLILDKGVGLVQREIDGNHADLLGICMIQRAAGVELDRYPSYWNMPDVDVDATSLAKNTLMERSFFRSFGDRDTIDNKLQYLFLPGSFNPLHFGHEELGIEALRRSSTLGGPTNLVYSTCINPPHKGELSISDMLERVANLKRKNYLLTKDDPFYLDKAKAFPGSWFIIGADVLMTLFDPKWNTSVDEVLNTFKSCATKLLVAGRVVNGNYLTLPDIYQVYPFLKGNEIFKEIPGRWDVSSTELRSKK